MSISARFRGHVGPMTEARGKSVPASRRQALYRSARSARGGRLPGRLHGNDLREPDLRPVLSSRQAPPASQLAGLPRAERLMAAASTARREPEMGGGLPPRWPERVSGGGDSRRSWSTRWCGGMISARTPQLNAARRSLGVALGCGPTTYPRIATRSAACSGLRRSVQESPSRRTRCCTSAVTGLPLPVLVQECIEYRDPGF